MAPMKKSNLEPKKRNQSRNWNLLRIIIWWLMVSSEHPEESRNSPPEQQQQQQHLALFLFLVVSRKTIAVPVCRIKGQGISNTGQNRPTFFLNQSIKAFNASNFVPVTLGFCVVRAICLKIRRRYEHSREWKPSAKGPKTFVSYLFLEWPCISAVSRW